MLKVYFGTINKKEGGRCYATGFGILGLPPFAYEMSFADYERFIRFLNIKFSNEVVSHNRHTPYFGKDVLIVSYDDINILDQEYYFIAKGELASFYKRNKFNEVISEFLFINK